MAMAAASMGVSSAAMLQQIQQALPLHHRNKDFVHLSACGLIVCRELQPRRTQRGYAGGGRRIVPASAASGSVNSCSNQIGRAAASNSYPGLKLSLQNGACSRCYHHISDRSTRRITSGRVQSSKQALAEEKRPGKELKPRRKFRLRGRLRLLLRYVRRGLSPPKGFSWRRVLLAALLTCTCTLAAVLLRLTGAPEPQSIPYSELVDHIHASTVTSALFEEGSQRLLFNVHQPVKEIDQVEELSNEASVSGMERTEKMVPKKVRRKSEWQYATRRVKNDEAYLLGLMRERGVRYSSAPQSVSASLRSLLLTVISLWIPLSPLLWLLHRQISGNSSSAQRRRSSNRLVQFDDVAGIDVAKAELIEVVACLRGASNYSTLGAKLPKGVLLVGPPGTGKTLLARAVAGEAGVPFFAASASEFVEMFVGRGAARVRELFAEARKHTPAIVFIDELDAVGGRRGRSFNDERDQTLNQLLTEMDGFDSETGVLVLAATNRPEVLDPALTRPGRISRRVNVEAPDFAGRQQVLAVHMRAMPVEGDPATLQEMVASKTSGFVGADLANVVNEAAFIAARQNRTRVVLEDFNEAVHRAKYGVGEKQKAASAIEKQFSHWFNWASRVQAKQLQGRNEQPEGYRAIPYNG